jgi:hypothetical protein
MAISSVPYTVGHNYVPEYQISALPYIVDSSDTRNFVIIRLVAAPNTVIGYSDTATGTVTIIDPDLDLTTVFVDTSGNDLIEESERKADNLLATYEAVEKPVIELPKISKWLQFLPSGGSIKVAFSRKDIAQGKFVEYTTDSYPLEIRCTNLYFDAAPAGQILAGLTTINRSAFSEVVETFLGDS